MTSADSTRRGPRSGTHLLWLAALLWLLVASFVSAEAAPAPSVLRAGAVAAVDRYGAAAAEEILAKGGNAIDAAVATAFALAVTYPGAGNIGGGGFMTIWFDGNPYFLDYRERAPASASRDMYLDGNGEIVPGRSIVGKLSVAVPGTVAGLWEAHRRFGKLSWKDDLAPALRYARDGFIFDDRLGQFRDFFVPRFAGKTNFSDYFGSIRVGETFRQPELAATLERIVAGGAREFYEGRTGELLVETMSGGPAGQGAPPVAAITRADLKNYRAIWRDPIVADWKGYRVITAPPPSSGGIGLVQLLRMKAALATAFDNAPLNSAQYIHLIAEIQKRVFADRAEYLADPDFFVVPTARLIDPGYLAMRVAEVNPKAISPTESVVPGLGSGQSPGPSAKPGLFDAEKPETTHFSIVDRRGNAVSNTYTLNGPFGSGVVVAGAGFLLNDEMDDFSAKAGAANRFGVFGADANAIAPGKRPLSSMTPTIVVKDGKVALVIGTPGGSRIFSWVFQVMTNLFDYGLPLPAAIAQMRVHHQLFPENTIFHEPFAPPQQEVVKQLGLRGYILRDQGWNGDIEAIAVEGGEPKPVSDPRSEGVAKVVR